MADEEAQFDEHADDLSKLPENTITTLSDRDRDRLLELLASPPPANAALREAMHKSVSRSDIKQ